MENSSRRSTEDALFESYPVCVQRRPSGSIDQLVPEKGSNTKLTINTEDIVEIFERAGNPDSGVELLKLFLGREETRLSYATKQYPSYSSLWNNSKKIRSISPTEILSLKTTPRFIKQLFNCFFRYELYGKLFSRKNIIMSGGSTAESNYGIPNVLKDCLTFALAKNWYGYSSSLGRESVRDAIARLESTLSNATISSSNIALTMGATSAFASLFDFISLTYGHRAKTEKTLCVIPNYPPIIEAANQHLNIELVPCDYTLEHNTLDNLIARVNDATPVIMLQTAINPSGKKICETQIEALIKKASTNTIIILDECHEILAAGRSAISTCRNNSNVIRVKSLSKDFSVPGLKIGWFIADREFIECFYEYASTNYGSTPSFFYLFTEVIARFERWYVEGISDIDNRHLREFESAYHLRLGDLSHAYNDYVNYRSDREHTIIAQRHHITTILNKTITTITPDFSVNIACLFEKYESSYSLYRDILYKSKVSVYPGILSFDFSNPIVRISPFIGSDMHMGISKIIKFQHS